MIDIFSTRRIPDSCFGSIIEFNQPNLERVLKSLDTKPDARLTALIAAKGLLVLPKLEAITEQPELLLRLSRLFGTEVENYHHT